jgi:hypothetical protein
VTVRERVCDRGCVRECERKFVKGRVCECVEESVREFLSVCVIVLVRKVCARDRVCV